MKHAFSQQMRNALKSVEPLFRFYLTDLAYSRRKNDPGISNFVLGNPQEMPLPGFTQALQRWTVPQNKTGLPTRETCLRPRSLLQLPCKSESACRLNPPTFQ